MCFVLCSKDDRLVAGHEVPGHGAPEVPDTDDCGSHAPEASAGASPVAYVESLHFERVSQLRARRDAELREEPIQVRLDGSMREVELLADLPVRESFGRELGDL